jgi:DNA polymerase-3 subunit alpha
MSCNEFKPQYIEVPPWSNEIQLQGEKETLGFYLTGHPLNSYLKELVHFTTCKIGEIHPNEHQTVKIVGIITKIRSRQTKRGERMAVFSLDDGTAQIEALCFADILQKYRSVLIEDQAILIEGNVNIDRFNNNTRMICREIYTIDQARERYAKYLQLHLSSMENFDLASFKYLLNTHSGNCPILIRYQRDHIKADIKLGKKWSIKPCEQLLISIKEQFAIEQLGYEY